MYDQSVRLSLHPRHSSAWLLTVGVIDVLAGLVAVVWPGVTVLALALVFGLLVLMAGATSVAVGLTARRHGQDGWVPLLFGGAAIVAGVLCLIHPGAGVFAVILGCALWFFLTGLGSLAMARMQTSMRVWFAVMGVLSVVASLILIVNPGVAITTVALIAGISFLIRGAGEIGLGWRLRGSHR